MTTCPQTIEITVLFCLVPEDINEQEAITTEDILYTTEDETTADHISTDKTTNETPSKPTTETTSGFATTVETTANEYITGVTTEEQHSE